MTLDGYIDEVGVRYVGGWAYDGQRAPDQIVVSIDGVEVARGAVTLDRPDLSFLTKEPIGYRVELQTPVTIGSVVSVTDGAGQHLKNSPQRISRLIGGKKEKALCALSRADKILEIGPSFNPTAPRSDGWQSYSLDHASEEELKAKYAGAQAIEKIEPVDFIWRGGPIEDAVPVEHHGTFDAIVLSHVIEHFPDPIGFYLSAARLLRSGGQICLVVPDKRVIFDFFKPVSTTGDLLTAHDERRTRHTKKSAFDYVAYNAFSRGDIAWSMREFDAFTIASGMNALHEAKAVFDNHVADETGDYVDYHNTIYTPSSFALSILELGQLGVIPFEIAYSYPTEGCEFYATLRKGDVFQMDPVALNDARLKLMKEVVRELGEQARWLADE